MPRRFSIVKLDPESANSLASTPDPIQRGPDEVGGIVGQRKLSESPSGSQASAINARGVAAGLSENGLIDPLSGFLAVHAVVWNDGQIIDLGTLEGGYESLASDINNHGQVVGASQNAIPDPFDYGGVQTRAVLWHNREIHDLGTLGTGNDAIATFVNDRGQVAGWSYTNSTPNPVTGAPTQDPYLWHDSKMLDLGTLGGTLGAPNAFNNRGQVVGFSNVAGDVFSHPFLWTRPGPMRDLGTFGGTFGEATWINDAGEVVGLASLPGDQIFHAFLWKDGVKTDLAPLDGDSTSDAHGINSKGQVVGSSENGPSSRGFLWENGKMFDLNTLVSPGSKLNLYFPTIINDRGEIAGQGQLPNSDIHAFVLIPCEGDLSDEEGCEAAAEGITAIQNNSVPVTLSPADLTAASDSRWFGHSSGHSSMINAMRGSEVAQSRREGSQLLLVGVAFMLGA
jgi:probable HAF family extracellular repeat protein